MFGEQYYDVGFFLLLTVIVYASYAGFKGVLKTDWIQLIGVLFPLIIFGIPILYTNYGSLSSLPEIYWTGQNPEYGTPFMIGIFIGFAPSIMIRSEFWQRIRCL